MKYEEIKKNIRRKYRRKEGYFGDIIEVGLAFKNGYAYEIAPCGCYRANSYRYADESEMLHYFDNHKNTHFHHAL